MPFLRSLLARFQTRTLQRRKIAPKVKALLRDDAGAILLIKHSLEGRWRLPGGFAAMDESGYEAVVRAVEELTGLRPLDPQPIARVDESQFRPDAMYGDFFQMYATLFLITRWESDLRPGREGWDARFFPSDALPPNLHEEASQALAALRAFEETGQVRAY
ncbi:MAG TPA: NUDIX domain-containing protein [Anaerolineae bacterium]|nr:NUDIX domain-containing protein [Caldilineae bacterium]HID33999.1 NUDIX domain-containing protein [Anaerolineae bacterium]